MWTGLLVHVLCCSFAHAHDPFETTTKILLSSDRAEMTMVMAQGMAEDLLGEQQFTQKGPSIELAPSRFYEMKQQGRPLELILKSVGVGQEGEARGDLVLTFSFALPSAGSLVLRATYLEELEQGYTGMVEVEREGSSELVDFKVLQSADPTLELQVPMRRAPEEHASAARTTATRSLSTFFVVGLEHVLLGFDHLLFLVSVLSCCRHFREVLGVLTTFTLAHSLTLSLATLRLVPQASGVVEPLIGLSICVAALWGSSLRKRRILLPATFVFGLVHGLGFAAGLEPLVSGDDARLLGLLGFNLGIELGQVVAALVVLPALEWCRRSVRGRTALDWTGKAVGAIGGAIFAWRSTGL